MLEFTNKDYENACYNLIHQKKMDKKYKFNIKKFIEDIKDKIELNNLYNEAIVKEFAIIPEEKKKEFVEEVQKLMKIKTQTKKMTALVIHNMKVQTALIKDFIKKFQNKELTEEENEKMVEKTVSFDHTFSTGYTNEYLYKIF